MMHRYRKDLWDWLGDFIAVCGCIFFAALSILIVIGLFALLYQIFTA